jgi:hypothetical protein
MPSPDKKPSSVIVLDDDSQSIRRKSFNKESIIFENTNQIE